MHALSHELYLDQFCKGPTYNTNLIYQYIFVKVLPAVVLVFHGWKGSKCDIATMSPLIV